MKIGYSTNSLGDIDLREALLVLCDQGYKSLAITPDQHLLNPYSKTFVSEINDWQRAFSKSSNEGASLKRALATFLIQKENTIRPFFRTRRMNGIAG